MWLYIPTSALPPGSAASTSELTEAQAERLARSAMWRSRYRPPSYWLRKWQRGGYLKLLSGLTCEPSTLEAGAAQWMESWRATPANHSALPAEARALTIPGTSGPTSPGASQPFALDGVSLRMFPDTSGGAISPKSDQTWKRLATAVRSKSSRRATLAHRTIGSGSSSWPWRTPGASPRGGSASRIEQKQQDQRLGPQVNLEDQVAIWPDEIIDPWPTALASDSHGHQYQTDREGQPESDPSRGLRGLGNGERAGWRSAIEGRGSEGGVVARRAGETMGLGSLGARPEFPPGRRNWGAWEQAAINGLPLPVEPSIRGVAHGPAGGLALPRAEQLKLIGNAVVPAQAAAAWRILWEVMT